MTDGEILDDIIKDSSQIITIDLQKEDKIKWELLVSAANQTKEELNSLIEISRDNLFAKSYEAGLLPTEASKFFKVEVAKTRLRYSIIHKIFQKKFDDFMNHNQERKALYVAVVDKQLFVYELDLEELYKKVGAAGTISGRNMSRLLKKSDKNFKLINDKNNKTLFSEDRLKASNAAWAGTYERLNRFATVNNFNFSSLKNGLLMWQIKTGQWQIFQVTNFGDIKEAYVASLFDKKDKLGTNIGTAPYYSHSLIENFAINYIAEVDTMGALLNEDVTTDFIDYAVKSSGFSLPNLKQYESAIDLILEESQRGVDIDYNNIRNKIIEQFGKSYKRNKILGAVDDYKNKTKDELLKEMGILK